MRQAILPTAVVLAGLTLLAQQPPQFRGGIQAVSLYATVTDRYGRLVSDLTGRDFEILDNGRPQPVSVFSSGLHPIVVVLLLDTSHSMTLNMDLMRAAAEQFVIRLLPGDRARVGSFSNRISISPHFTSDRDDLLRVLRDDIEFGNPTLLWDALDESMEAVKGEDGRRVTVVLTDGADTLSKRTRADVLRRAEEEGLSIYVLWMRGSFQLENDRPTNVSPPVIYDSLQRLARDSGGGFFIVGRGDSLNYTLARVAQELHYEYVLGFVPERLDDKMHELEVRVKRPGLIVQSRKNYFAGPHPHSLPRARLADSLGAAARLTAGPW